MYRVGGAVPRSTTCYIEKITTLSCVIVRLTPSAFADFFLAQHKQLIVLEGCRAFGDSLVALCKNVVEFLIREAFDIDVVLTVFHQRPPLVLLHINSLFIAYVQPA